MLNNPESHTIEGWAKRADALNDENATLRAQVALLEPNNQFLAQRCDELKEQVAELENCHCCGKAIVDQQAFVKCPACDTKDCEKLATVTQERDLRDETIRALSEQLTQALCIEQSTYRDLQLITVQERDALEGKLIRLQEFVNNSAYGRELAEAQARVTWLERP